VRLPFVGSDHTDQPAEALKLPLQSTGPQPARLLLVLERSETEPEAAAVATWLARGMGAEVVVVAAVERDPRWSLSIFDQDNLDAVRRNVESMVEHLVSEGVSASGEVAISGVGEGARAIREVADEVDADLLAVVANRTSWLFILPGSSIAHHLMRTSGRPVLLIPNRPQERPRAHAEQGRGARLEVLRASTDSPRRALSDDAS
jgi:nucleotide-binding universal stress UspA family protein